MSQQLINRSPDLKKLRDEGFDARIVANHLVVGDVPYVNSKKEVKLGMLVSDLSLSGDVTTTPGDHVARFVGECPCDKDGSVLTKLLLDSQTHTFSSDLVTQHSFSSKPRGGYKDYYDKMTTYIAILATPAQTLDPSVTPKTFRTIESEGTDSPFQYVDTASSRAGISAVTVKLASPKIAIIGLGGTGAYVLDLIAKSPVKEIHIFDGDILLQHNAFRFPGAPSLDELRTQPTKVEYLRRLYSNIHRHIHAHSTNIDEANIHELRGMSFVFLCLDKSKVKRLIISKLEEFGVPFIDVGMGVNLVDGALLGVLRVTTGTIEKHDHIRQCISFADGDANNDYAHNIQIADLNALNASLAVIKWKKLCGFYHDLEHEHQSLYTIDGNVMNNANETR